MGQIVLVNTGFTPFEVELRHDICCTDTECACTQQVIGRIESEAKVTSANDAREVNGRTVSARKILVPAVVTLWPKGRPGDRAVVTDRAKDLPVVKTRKASGALRIEEVKVPK